MTAVLSPTSTVLRRLTLAGVVLTVALAFHLGPANTALAADCSKVKVGKFKVKKITVSAGIACHDARRVAKRWVKSGYDDFNPIFQGDDRWFCSWRRRAPQSLTTGTAECDADPGEGINFAVRKRR